MQEKSNYQTEIDEFNLHFSRFRDKAIVLYGIGRRTATLVEHIDEYHIVGLLDRDPGNLGKNYYGYPVISLEEAEQLADMIIINTTMPTTTRHPNLFDFCADSC